MATTYKIGEAAALLNLKTYVLRFWETEFPEIVPLRTGKGQRLYTEEHLALLERIRYLLHERGLTIGGARRALAEEKAHGAVYVFGASSAVARKNKQDDLALDPVDEIEDAADAVAEQDEDAADMDEDAPLSSLHQTGRRKRPQYNLPGLEQLIALSKSITAAAATPETASDNEFDDWLDDGADQQLTSPEAGPPTQSILPLFAMGRNAFLAPDKEHGAPNSGRGGDNFIQAGVDSALPAAPNAGGEACVPGTEVAARAHVETLRLIIEEMEAVARILRPDKPADSGAGKRGLRIALR